MCRDSRLSELENTGKPDIKKEIGLHCTAMVHHSKRQQRASNAESKNEDRQRW